MQGTVVAEGCIADMVGKKERGEKERTPTCGPHIYFLVYLVTKLPSGCHVSENHLQYHLRSHFVPVLIVEGVFVSDLTVEGCTLDSTNI